MNDNVKEEAESAASLTPETLTQIFAGGWDTAAALSDLRENQPVAFVAELDVWLVSRYDDCITVIRDGERFGHMPTDMMSAVPSEVAAELPEGYPVWFASLINTDPPVHTRVRKLAQKPITSKGVAPKEERIRQLANELIDGFQADGRTDIVAAYALPLPVMVLTHILGIPDHDVERFRQWAYNTTELFMPTISAERRVELARDQVGFATYVANAIAERRRAPSDDLISKMIASEAEGERRLTDREVHGIIAQLILAGFDTTAGAMSFALLHLCRDPHTMARVRADPSLIPTVVEETIRRTTPARGVVRETKCDVEMRGQTIPEGARVMALVGSANLDPEQFSCPHEFDIDRDPRELRRHIGFGQGVHKCIGQPIAQLDLRVALETLLDRLPKLRLADPDGDIPTIPGMIFMRPERLDLAWDD